MENPELQLAEAFIEQTDRHLFLTGKAGTGKTTFLRRLRKSSPKRMVVTAPTGVAAVNARGVTLHSFFQLPFGPLIHGRNPQGAEGSRRLSKAKRRVIESLDLLVIDETSMVRADVLDGVDEVLRRLRRNPRPFGGVQLLMIGDLGQLAPIAREEEQEILRQFYDSPFFFSSRALRDCDWLTIELRQIYRQSDPRFVELLNQVREGGLDDRSLGLLESRYRPTFEPPQDEGWIILSTHNRRVDAHNRDRLGRLPGKAEKLVASVTGTFPASSCQAPEELELKVGAQVVFLRNDTDRPPRYFNGKVAVVTGLSSEEIRLRCPEDSAEIRLERATWDHVSYRLDEKKGEVREHVLGSFSQFPLRLAWAMTIHKSQGLTFERAVIDAGRAFAPGQVYVALSRCKTLDGLVLLSSISPHSIRADPTVRRFLSARRPDRPLAELLGPARLEYRWRILNEAFDLDDLGREAQALLGRIRSAGPLLRVSGERISGVEALEDTLATARQSLFTVSGAFRRELGKYASQGLDPVEDPQVGERIAKATAYFADKLRADVEPLTELRLMTDNQEIEGRVNASLESLRLAYGSALAVVMACAEGYEPARVVRARSEAAKGPRSSRRKRSKIEVPADTPHRELVERILKWRAGQAEKKGISPNSVIHQRIAFAIAVELPTNRAALKRIHGVGPATLMSYGKDLLTLVTDYRSTLSPSERRAKVDKVTKSTRDQSFELFRSGLSVEKIAEKRKLAVSTVEGHLATFVESGELEVGELVSPERQKAIGAVLNELPEESRLSEVHSALGGEYSYGEIRMMKSHRARVDAKGDGA